MSGLEPFLAALTASAAAPATAGATAAMGTGAALGLGGLDALLAGEAAASGLSGLGAASAAGGLLGKGASALGKGAKAAQLAGLLGQEEPRKMPANPALLGAVQAPPRVPTIPTPAEFYSSDEDRKKKLMMLQRARQMGLA